MTYAPADLSERQRLVRESIRELCADYEPSYWRSKDEAGDYPQEFVDALGEQGWFGILIPEEYGGAGMTTEEAVVMMEEIAAGGGGFSAAQAVHGAIYTSVPIVEYGSESMKADLLPAVADGEEAIQAFALTEPNAGSDSTAIETTAERDGDGYRINGQKIWTSRVEVSDYMVLMTRTTPREQVAKKTLGMTMFLADLEEAIGGGSLTFEEIPKTATNSVHAYQLWLDDLWLPAEAVIGEIDNGFTQMLAGLNEERLVIAAECVGLGEAALAAGVEYARERVVFDRPIGERQAIQHPLADAYARVAAAKRVVYAAAAANARETKIDVGAQANLAKYLAADAAFIAADAAVQTHGGFGVARGYDVERFLREARLTRIVPITQQLVLNYIGENVLGLPRSY